MFSSQSEGIFTNEIENNVFYEEVKTDIDAELAFDPDIHPDRIRFSKVTDVPRKFNTRNHSYAASSTAITLGPRGECGL